MTVTALAGMRVMRGPHWEHGDTDGGEGHVGTLTELLSDGTVHVQWDKGQESVCSAGADGKFELRIFDTAQAGVRHPGTRCAECGDAHIYGMLWRCQDCSSCDLCTLCYGDDKHNIRHRFLRIDHYQSQGEPVKKRKVSVRMRSMGTFPGAKVTRGPDWAWADQDGGIGSHGEVKAYENVAPNSSRNLVQVQWEKGGKSNSYRLGFAGNVDLTCVEVEVGPFYYRDHLPLLDASSLPYPLAPVTAFDSTPPNITPTSTAIATSSASTTTTTSSSSDSSNLPPTIPPRNHQGLPSGLPSQDNATQPPPLPPRTRPQTPSQQQSHSPNIAQPAPTAASQDGSGGAASMGTDSGGSMEDETEEELSLVVGDTVMVGVSENAFRDLQEDFGGVSERMITKLGTKGTVTEVNTGVIVRFASSTYRLNPLALIKVMSPNQGDVIRIRRDAQQVKMLTKHVAWNQQIADTCGKVGRVVMVNTDDTVTVTFGHFQTFRFSTACCLPAPNASLNPGGSLVKARKAAVAEREATLDVNQNPAKAGNCSAKRSSPVTAAVGGMNVPGRSSPKAQISQKTEKQTNENITQRPGVGVSAGRCSPGLATVGATSQAGGAGAALDQGSTADNFVPVPSNDSDMGQQLRMLMGGTDSDNALRDVVLRRMGIGNSDDDCSNLQLKLLFSLISRGDVSAVETMVRANMHLLTETEQTLTPLMYACHSGKREVVTKLLELGADVNGVGGQGRTPLYVAIDGEEEDIAMMLLDRGANPNTTSSKGRTPLHAAAFEGMSSVAQMLICMGADVNAKDVVQDTPLFDAIEKMNNGVVEVILQADSLNTGELNIKGFNMIQVASLRGNTRALELIFGSERYPSVDELLLGEYSALHIAANNDHSDCVGLLVLLGGATIDIGDGRRHLTPLHLACKRRHFKAAKALIELGATVNVGDVNGNTPLHLAVGKSLESDRDDSDVSHSVAVEQRTKVACLLIDSGALVDVPDDTGNPPLYYASSLIQDNVTKYLASISGGLPNPETQTTNTTQSGQDSNPASGADPTQPVPATTTKAESDVAPSKQDDPELLNKLLQGISIQCASCDAMSDVTLQPCGHKTVCHQCCDDVTQCPQCGADVEDKVPDNTDDQEEEDEEDEATSMNTSNHEEEEDEEKEDDGNEEEWEEVLKKDIDQDEEKEEGKQEWNQFE